MRWILAPLKIVYLVWAALTFLIIMLLVLPFVVVGSLFGKIKGGNFIFRMCMIWGDCWFFLIGIRQKNIYEVPHDKNAHYIFVANHISYLDAPIIVKAVRQPIRVLGKIEMGKIPIFGYIYKRAIVTVDRSSAENRAKSVRVLKSVIKKGISIFIFPEGTFNEQHTPLKSFFDGAFKIAIEAQVPIKPILFLDAYDRMNYKSVFSLSPGKCRAVYLAPISVEGYTMKDLDRLKQEVYKVMELKLLEYNASWVQEYQVKEKEVNNAK
ncbi:MULTISPECIES: lysophospholipid acyltransferase family protein [unclassified Paraflavitalea]|uniref:lysophospholipid acyltransferase family protein n=1 Tax=unclassified Paraflavitalea TaxID=2798305 RepID=UPI003D3335BD